MKLTVTGKRHNRSEDGKLKTYEMGESFEGTEVELANFSDRLTPSEVVAAEAKAKAKKPAAKKDGNS